MEQGLEAREHQVGAAIQQSQPSFSRLSKSGWTAELLHYWTAGQRVGGVSEQSKLNQE